MSDKDLEPRLLELERRVSRLEEVFEGLRVKVLRILEGMRHGALVWVGIAETLMGRRPTTKELRQWYREEQREGGGEGGT